MVAHVISCICESYELVSDIENASTNVRCKSSGFVIVPVSRPLPSGLYTELVSIHESQRIRAENARISRNSYPKLRSSGDDYTESREGIRRHVVLGLGGVFTSLGLFLVRCWADFNLDDGNRMYLQHALDGVSPGFVSSVNLRIERTELPRRRVFAEHSDRPT